MTSTTQIQTSVLDAFQVELLTALQPYMDEVEFAAGECLYAEGDLSDAFFIVKEGDVRLQIHSLEVDTDPVLDYVGAGSFIGHDSVLAGVNLGLACFSMRVHPVPPRDGRVGRIGDESSRRDSRGHSENRGDGAPFAIVKE